MPQFTDYPIADGLTGSSIFLIVDPTDGKTKQTTLAAISGSAGDGCCNLQATLDVGATATIALVDITGDLRVQGNVRGTTFTVEGGTIESTTIGAVTPSTVSSTTLDASGATNLADVLNVTGATTLSSTLTVTAATQLNNTLSVASTSMLTGTVTTVGDVNIGGNTIITGTLANGDVTLSGGLVDGITIGSLVAAAGTFTTLTATGAITSGGDMGVAPGSSVVVDPAAPGGTIAAMYVGSNPSVGIDFYGASAVLPPDQVHVKADAGITLNIGPADRLSIASTGPGLAEYTGATFSSAAISAAPATILINKGWVETLEANRAYDLAGFTQGYLNVGGGIAIGGATASAGTSLDIQTTEGFGLPSLTTAQQGGLEPTIAKAGTTWYNSETKNTMISTAAANASLLSQPYTPKNVNAGLTPYTILAGENFITCDTSVVEIALTLPLAVNRAPGESICIKDTAMNAENKNITISPAGGNTIDLGGAVTIGSNGGYYKLTSDGGTNWMVVDFAMPSPTEHIFKGTLASAQIQALNATPVVVIPAVTGKLPVIKHVNLTLRAAAGAVLYNNVSLQLESTAILAAKEPMFSFDCLSYPVGVQTPNFSMPPSTASAAGPGTPGQYVGSQGVQFTATGATGAGDWDIDYFITAYYI
tara:strand:- start:121 stop:2064 length:1944 start_codon:yes stop_codon:yes gene_type:complete